MKLSSKVKNAIMAVVLVVAGIGVAFVPAYAADSDIINGSGWKNAVHETSNKANMANQDLSGIVTNVINIILYVIGVLAIIMIVVGGIRYTTSAGDQAAVTKAKNTILYGIVGLVIAVLAYAIVNFVLKAVGVNLN